MENIVKGMFLVAILWWVFCLGCIVSVILFAFSWISKHDKAVDGAGEAYTACVVATYHMQPQAYFAQTGVYPTCPQN